MKLICRLFGHNLMPRIVSTPITVGGRVYITRGMQHRCGRCGLVQENVS